MLVALAITVLLVIVALVIDLGFVRNTRQGSKATTDATVAAGLQSLAADGLPTPWRGACASLAYLRDNEAGRTFTVEYRDGNFNPVAGTPCTSLLSQGCLANTKSTWAWIRATDGDYVVDIRSGYVTPDASFPEDSAAYASDNGDPVRGGCDQIAVIAATRDDVYFGGVAGAGGYESAIRTVGRVDISTVNEGVPAFLLLERSVCGVMTHSVGNGGGDGIIVEAASATEPGIVHIDSSGASGCSNNDTENGYTVYGTTIDGDPGILVQGAGAPPSAVPGILSLRALSSGNAARAWGTATGVSPAGTPGGLISRAPVDAKYNPTSNPTITMLHGVARADANRTTAPAGYTTVDTCNNHNPTDAQRAATLIFIDCPGGYSPDDASFTAAQDVITNGYLHVPNNKRLYFPAAQRIVVGGTGTRGLEVSGGGILGINSVTPLAADTDAATRAACTGREGPVWSNTTKLIVFGGSGSGAGEGGLNIGGRAALCQTFAYLAGPKSIATFAPQQVTDGSGDATCIASTPCPRTSGNLAEDANLIVSGFLRWSAPNQSTAQPPSGSVGVEDLSLWSETAKTSEVKSGGVLEARGVHFLPNSRVEMRSPAVAAPQDAQFIARSLKLFAGTLRMKPTPANNVQINILTGVQLVR